MTLTHLIFFFIKCQKQSCQTYKICKEYTYMDLTDRSTILFCLTRQYCLDYISTVFVVPLPKGPYLKLEFFLNWTKDGIFRLPLYHYNVFIYIRETNLFIPVIRFSLCPIITFVSLYLITLLIFFTFFSQCKWRKFSSLLGFNPKTVRCFLQIWKKNAIREASFDQSSLDSFCIPNLPILIRPDLILMIISNRAGYLFPRAIYKNKYFTKLNYNQLTFINYSKLIWNSFQTKRLVYTSRFIRNLLVVGCTADHNRANHC